MLREEKDGRGRQSAGEKGTRIEGEGGGGG